MEITFRYDNSPYFNIKNIAVIGGFNNFNSDAGQMKLVGEDWIYSHEINKGEHPYRFVINESLEIVDPEAGLFFVDSKEKIWSLLMIDDNYQRLYSSEPSSIHIENYYMYNKITDEELIGSKKQFNLTNDTKVCVKFELSNIIGVHNISIVWFSPLGQTLKIDERFEVHRSIMYSSFGKYK